MEALRTLPSHYKLHLTLDLAKNRRVTTGLNLVAAGFFFLFGGLAVLLSSAVRADTLMAILRALVWLQAAGVLAIIVVLVGLQSLMVVLHEAVHGAFFLVFTRECPVFGLKPPYAAYAAAPDWYLPRDQHLVVGLGPFVVITLVGAALLFVVPAAFVPPLLFIAASNAAGAVGDFLMVARLLRQPRDALVKDTGSAITVYHPG
jgi:hypothetical protein